MPGCHPQEPAQARDVDSGKPNEVQQGQGQKSNHTLGCIKVSVSSTRRKVILSLCSAGVPCPASGPPAQAHGAAGAGAQKTKMIRGPQVQAPSSLSHSCSAKITPWGLWECHLSQTSWPPIHPQHGLDVSWVH